MHPLLHPLVSYIPENLPGRARKPPEEIRSKRVSLPVSLVEKEALRMLAEERGCTISAILRSAIGSIPPPRVEVALLKQVHSVGVNFNQVVRALNAGLFQDERPIGPALEELSAVFQDVLQELRTSKFERGKRA